MERPGRVIFPALLLVVSVMGTGPAAAVFTISLDNTAVPFWSAGVGTTIGLPAGAGHHHIVTVASDQSPWYLKVSVTGALSSGAASIPLGNFSWKLDSTDGTGTIANPGVLTGFTTSPVLAYTASAGDAGGQNVPLRFRYQLVVPADQRAGAYSTTVTYDLVQIL